MALGGVGYQMSMGSGGWGGESLLTFSHVQAHGFY